MLISVFQNFKNSHALYLYACVCFSFINLSNLGYSYGIPVENHISISRKNFSLSKRLQKPFEVFILLIDTKMKFLCYSCILYKGHIWVQIMEITTNHSSNIKGTTRIWFNTTFLYKELDIWLWIFIEFISMSI